MISLTFFNHRFTSNWPMSFLAFLAIIFFSGLGEWQLKRAEEKKQMLVEYQRLSKQKPINWEPKMPLPKQYQLIRLEGHYLEQNLLLDNQHHQHQFGYHVLTPFFLDSKNLILVDRGWIVGDQSRRIFPKRMIPAGFLKIVGTVYYPSKKNWVLGEPLEKKTAEATLIERIDLTELSHFLHKSIYPFIIRLENDGSKEYVREWPIVSMPPERHYAYALQWFAMATLVLILFIALNLRKIHEH